MNNDIDFECMEPVVDAICKSLEEDPEDWQGYAFSRGYCVLSCRKGDFEGYRLTGLDGMNLLQVSKDSFATNSNPFSSEQCKRIRRSRSLGLTNLINKEDQAIKNDLLNRVQPKRVKLKDAHLYSVTDRKVEDHHPLNEQRPSCFPPSAVFLVLIGIAIIGLTL